MNDRVTGPSSILSPVHISNGRFETHLNHVTFLELCEWQTVYTVYYIRLSTSVLAIPKKRKIPASFCMYGTRLTGDREGRRRLKAALRDTAGTGVGSVRYLWNRSVTVATFIIIHSGRHTFLWKLVRDTRTSSPSLTLSFPLLSLLSIVFLVYSLISRILFAE